ncbi:MAG: hypothetical protein IPM06_18840 [Rhizobiales bacterium]|nr:hypothetical protein [Hyphomicrobiales bacterium]
MNLNLTEHEAESTLWKKIRAEMVIELELCRRKNDGELDEIKTARLRGRIGMLKELLAPASQAREGAAHGS